MVNRRVTKAKAKRQSAKTKPGVREEQGTLIDAPTEAQALRRKLAAALRVAVCKVQECDYLAAQRETIEAQELVDALRKLDGLPERAGDELESITREIEARYVEQRDAATEHARYRTFVDWLESHDMISDDLRVGFFAGCRHSV